MIYLDNSATTKPYNDAIETYKIVSEKFFANPSSLHRLGGASEDLLMKSREQAARLLDVKSSEIIFTSGGTEGNNLAIKGTALTFKERGKHLITTQVEHASVYLAFRQLEAIGFEVTYLPVDKDGRVSVADFKKALRDETILVSMIHVNNEIGTVQPIEEIAEIVRDRPKTLFHVDQVQGIGKVPLTFAQSGIDFCTLSGHKFHSTKGTGILYMKEGIKLDPLFSGGGHEYGMRSGTENLPGIAAMLKALRLTLESANKSRQQLSEMTNYLRQQLQLIQDIVIQTPEAESAPHIINFAVKGLKAEVLVHALEEEDIYISTKSACSSQQGEASRVLLASGVEETLAKQSVRVSLSFTNTMADIEAFINALNKKLSDLQRVMG